MPRSHTPSHFQGKLLTRLLIALAGMGLIGISPSPAAEPQPPSWRKSEKADAQSRSEARITLQFNKIQIESVAASFSQASGKSILLGQGLKGKEVAAFFEDMPVDRALQVFADANELRVVDKEDCLLLVTRKEYMLLYAPTETVLLKHASSEVLVGVLSKFTPNDDLVQLTADTRSRILAVRGAPERIEPIVELARKLDDSLVTKVFIIRYAAADKVAGALEEELRIRKDKEGAATLGTIVVDQRSNRIVVNDIQESIDICERIIASLDVPVETRVFSTGTLDPKIVADQISRGELGTPDQKNQQGAVSSPEKTVQAMEGTNQILVTDTPERLEILAKIMDELNRGIETRVLIPKNASPQDVAAVLKTAYPEVPSAVDMRTGSIVVKANRDLMDQLVELVDKLDARENIQLEIEARIMLVSREKLKQLGVHIYGQDLGGSNESLANVTTNPNFPADDVKAEGRPMGNPPGGPVTNPVKTSGNFVEALQPNIQAQAIIRALERDGDTTILSNPRLKMIIGKASSIFSGSREPYKVTTFQNNQAVESVEFIDVGVTFEATPLISPGEIITLEVSTEFSNLREVRDGIPVVDTRTAHSTVQTVDGQTIFLGGLITKETDKRGSGIPGLRSIPVLGYLFGEKGTKSIDRELVIVLSPRIHRQDESGLSAISPDFSLTQDQFTGEGKVKQPEGKAEEPAQDVEEPKEAEKADSEKKE